LIAFISINSFAKYSEVGNITLLTLILLFGVAAWWYCEDRDRRNGAAGDEHDGDAGPGAGDER
jgi:hypothetical protein